MKDENTLISIDETSITNLIYTIRGKQVMLDSDLAALYQVETKYLNRQRGRNSDRFPEDFCFQLTKEEYDFLRCQNVTSKNGEGSGGRRYMPYMFTEQGIAMLSSVLKSDVATKVSVNIMRAFVEMRKFVLSNSEMFARLDRVELKQKKLILIDNYVDVNTLNLLCKKKTGVDVLIATAGKGRLSTKDINKFNAQYPRLSVKTTTDFHDRFLVIDDQEVYLIGASIKDAGKKSFAITKIEDGKIVQDLVNKVK